MKTYLATTKGSKGGSVTLKTARSAAKAVRGDRPAGRFLVTESSNSKELHDRFLGAIVHGAKSGTGVQVHSKAVSKRVGVSRKVAKKK